MNHLKGWVHSLSGVWDPTYTDEKEDALRKVRAFTGASGIKITEGTKDQQASATGPVRDVDIVDITQIEAMGPDQHGRRQSLDSINSSVFDIGGKTSTPVRKPDRRKVTIQDIGPEESIEQFPLVGTQGLSDLPEVTKVTHLESTVETGGQLMEKGRLAQMVNDTQLPLDSSVLQEYNKVNLDQGLEKLQAVRMELKLLDEQKDNLLVAMKRRESELAKLEELSVLEQQKLFELKMASEAREEKLDKLCSLGNDIGARVEEARAHLKMILSETSVAEAKRSLMAETPLKQTLPTPEITAPVTPVETRVSPGVFKTSVTDQVLGARSSASVYTPVAKLSANNTPVPRPRVRKGLTPIQQARYDRNPAIAMLGIDTVPKSLEEIKPPSYQFDFGEARQPDAARQKAIEIKPFTGDIPYRKWMLRYKGIVETNRWNNSQALIALKTALMGGPGDKALQAYEESGLYTLSSLLDCAHWALHRVGEYDPRSVLHKRVQKKDEHIRVYGFAVQDLVSEVYSGCSPDTPSVVQELTTRFVNGVRDSDLQAYLREKWQPDLSLVDLFEHAEAFEAKKAFFPTLGAVSTVTEVDSSVEVSALQGNKKEKTNKKSSKKSVSSVVEDSDLEKMMEKLLKKHLSKDAPASSSFKKNKNKSKSVVCRRCLEKGHYASDCTAAKPIKKITKDEKSEN
jgi:hypothetical protein